MPQPNYISGVGNANFFGIDNSEQSPYLDTAPSGFGSDYDRLFAANPYRDLTYHQSGFQKFLSSLGFRTKYDDFVEQAQINAREYDAGIFQTMFQNEFNSPLAQADRMRVAGQNPDLLGTGDVVGAASPMDDPNGMNLAPTQEPDFSGIINQFATNGFKICTTVLSMMKDVKSLKQMDLLNEGAEITNGQNVLGLIYDTIINTSSPDARPDPKTLSGALDIALAQMFPEQKDRERYGALAQQVANSLPADAEQWRLWYERAKSKEGYARVAGQSNYDEGVGDMMMSFFGALTDLRTGLEERFAEWQTSEWNEQFQYNQGHDAFKQAEAANAMSDADIAIAKYQKQSAEVAEALNSTFENWTKQLKASADKGNTWAQIGLALVGTLRLIITQGFHYSGTQKDVSGNSSTFGISLGR